MSTHLLIGLLTSIVITSSDTHICDGNNLICAAATVHCLDNEPCLVQCTGASDCVDTTIHCPINSTCTIECHTAAQDFGCKVASINATQSSSLLLDNKNVKNGFESSPIYCPLFGTCSMIGSGKDAYKNVQIYASFGFVFNTASITCTGNCKTGAIMYCGNEYNSSCLFAENGISCTNAPNTCDTIFRSISGTWHDDYSINPAPGWIVTDQNNRPLINSVYTGSLNTYHGPFHGNTIQENSIETYSLVQYFYCAYSASVYVEYFYGYSCQEDTDYSQLFLNDQLMVKKHAKAKTGNGFKDDNLEAFVSDLCSDAWHSKWLNGTLTNVVANTFFKVQIDVAMNYVMEASVIRSVAVTCIPTTNHVTSSPNSAVLVPTMFPSVVPTVAPSDHPSLSPTMQPVPPTTATPTAVTASPVTAAPTMNTATPSNDPSNAPIQTTPQPTNAPLGSTDIDHTGQGFDVWHEVKLQTSSTENVDLEGLIVALIIVGGFFVFTVVLVCKLWIKHEKAYRPIYAKRQQMLQRMMAETNGTPQDDSGSVVMETIGKPQESW
eukprot:300434_1